MKKLAIILMLGLSVNSFAIGSARARNIAKEEVNAGVHYATQVCSNKTDTLKKENAQLRAEIQELRVLVVELRQQMKEMYDQQKNTNNNKK
jgi:hypothetical protein